MNLTIEDLMEAGVHYGHRTSRWNAAMKPFIYGERNNIHIINAAITYAQLDEAYIKAREIAGKGGQVLFVGTKAQAKPAIEAEATRSGQPYVINRWLGGTLTNFRTISTAVQKLISQESILTETGAAEATGRRKRMLLEVRKEFEKRNRMLGGLKIMSKAPSAVFIVDVVREAIAVHEAQCLGIPVIGICDTNSNPAVCDLAIPGNDDAVRAIHLYARVIADGCLDGKTDYEAKLRADQAERQAAAAAAGDADKPERSEHAENKKVIRKVSKVSKAGAGKPKAAPAAEGAE